VCLRFCLLGFVACGATSRQSPPAERAIEPPQVPARSGHPVERTRLDRYLGPPGLYGLVVGTETPQSAAAKLNLPLPNGAGACPENPNLGYRWLQVYCWAKVSSTVGALALEFVDVGDGPVLQGFRAEVLGADWGPTLSEIASQYGPPDFEPPSDGMPKRGWSWGRSSLTVYGGQPIVVIGDDQWLSSLASQKRVPIKPAPQSPRPLGLQLGQDTISEVAAKLDAAGLNSKAFECRSEFTHLSHRRFAVCTLQNPASVDGLTWAEVNFVDIGDGLMRLAQVNYHLDARVQRATLAEIMEKYGEGDGAGTRWVGLTSVTTTIVDNATPPFFGLSYGHGRLAEMWSSAMSEEHALQRERQGRAF